MFPQLFQNIETNCQEASKAWNNTEEKHQANLVSNWSLSVVINILEHVPLEDRIDICNTTLRHCLKSDSKKEEIQPQDKVEQVKSKAEQSAFVNSKLHFMIVDQLQSLIEKYARSNDEYTTRKNEITLKMQVNEKKFKLLYQQTLDMQASLEDDELEQSPDMIAAVMTPQKKIQDMHVNKLEVLETEFYDMQKVLINLLENKDKAQNEGNGQQAQGGNAASIQVQMMSLSYQLDKIKPEEIAFLARVCESAELWTDMVEVASQILKQQSGSIMSNDIRVSIQVACKKFISINREAYFKIEAVEKKYPQWADAVKGYKEIVQERIRQDCIRVINSVEAYLKLNQNKKFQAQAEQEKNSENQLFFHKMVGDYYRYICEVSRGLKLEQIKMKGMNAYEKAGSIKISYSNVIKIGLGLNLSVFTQECIKDTEQALKISNLTIKNYESADKSQYTNQEKKDIEDIIRLIKENIVLWAKK